MKLYQTGYQAAIGQAADSMLRGLDDHRGSMDDLG